MDENKQPYDNNKAKEKQRTVGLLMLEAGTEFAFLIAVPLIAGILAGNWLDSKYKHHFFIIIGILLGITITSVAVYSRVKDYKKMLK